jgi:hypothetical protein
MTDAHGTDVFLRELLAGGPMPAGTIKAAADDAGHAWRTVQRAASRIGAERRKDGLRGGWMWALNQEAKAPRQPEGASPQANAIPPAQAPAVARPVAPSNDEAAYQAHRWQCLACLAADRLPKFEHCAIGQRLRGALVAAADARDTKGTL